MEGERRQTPNETVSQQAETIAEQRGTIEELETPVIEVWDKILTLPIIGTVDTVRAQNMTERLLEKIVEAKSEVVILDITGVALIDTAVSRHLLETVTAARLLGAEVFIVGVSSRTAMTLVQLGLDLSHLTTRTTLARGLELAFDHLGLEVVKRSERQA